MALSQSRVVLLVLLSGIALSLALTSSASGSCGDWLAHAEQEQKKGSGVVFADSKFDVDRPFSGENNSRPPGSTETPVSGAKSAAAEPLRPPPCDGLHCGKLPPLPAPPAPVEIVPRGGTSAIAGAWIAYEHAAEVCEFFAAETGVWPIAGFPAGIDRPPCA